jgi:hypothetical protein
MLSRQAKVLSQIFFFFFSPKNQTVPCHIPTHGPYNSSPSHNKSHKCNCLLLSHLQNIVITVKGKEEIDPNAMKVYWGSRGIAPFLTTALHGDVKSISRQDSFTTGMEGEPVPTEQQVGWAHKLDPDGFKDHLAPTGIRSPDRLAQRLTIPYTLSGLPPINLAQNSFATHGLNSLLRKT